MASKPLQLALLMFLSLILLRSTFLASYLFSNVAWLHLSRARSFRVAQVSWVESTLDLFHTATRVDRTNRRAFLGLGMTYTVIGDDANALANWHEAGATPNELIELADSFMLSEFYDEALIYYKGASELSLVQPSEASFQAANVCQLTFEQLSILNWSNQLFCREYFDQNEGNLIVNGQFVGKGLSGWGVRYFSGPTSVIYAIDETIGRPPAAVSVTGLTKAYHGGLFQTVALPAGVEVRYSAWFKVQNVDLLDARLLYISGRQDGQPFGNALRAVTKDMEWTYLERTVQLPRVDNSIYTFFPVLLTGKGTVWIDNVTLEILPER